MSSKFCGFLIFLIKFVTAVEFFCYDCTGYEEGKCVDAKKAAIYNCYDELGGQYDPTIYVGCYSIYLNYSGLFDIDNNPRDYETGIYRGCAIVPSYITEYCAWHTAELGLYNITVNSCASCDSDRCNDHVFDEKSGNIVGRADTNSGILSASVGWIIGFICVYWQHTLL